MPELQTRPIIMGRRGVVTSGHYLATAAGFRIFEQGGNAIDAASAMCFCLNILEPHNSGLGGEAPTLIYSAKERKVYAVSGMGWSPRSLNLEWLRDQGVTGLLPGDGYLPACVPSVVDTWALALERFGTMSFAQVLEPAIDLAENGFPMYDALRGCLVGYRDKFGRHYPTTLAAYYPGGRVPEVGEIVRYPDWAGTLRMLCQAEASARHKGRAAGIEAARDCFYKGPIAEKIVEFISTHPVEDQAGHCFKGLLSHDDFAEWRARLEEPVCYNYRGFDVFKCPAWTQGPVFLQQLALLEGYDLRGLGHNSADYVHLLMECAKLAFADREAWYGDPDFDNVPLEVLLSKEYTEERRRLIGEEASLEMRPGAAGGITPVWAAFDAAEGGLNNNTRSGAPENGDTTHLDAVDAEGNMVASTPSGGWIPSSPVIAGLGFPLGTRGQMFYINPNRPNALAPRKRPRATLTPSLVMKGGEPHMVFGTPGGDSQDQWTLQFFLNHADFGMDLQTALDAPTFHSEHFPSSFYPRQAYPGRVVIESRIPQDVIDELRRRGHEVIVTGGWVNGRVMGICYDRAGGLIMGAASAKNVTSYAMGW